MADEVEQIDIEHLQLEPPKTCINSLLPSTDLGLTKEEQIEFDAYQVTTTILGPAAGAVLLCPGNQEKTLPDDRCPYFAKCPLRRAGKAPKDKLCPVERKIVEDRFSAWCKEVGTEADTISESDRSAVADLVWIDLQIQRCVNILSSGDTSRMTQRNVTDAVLMDPDEPPTTVATERVLHVVTARLDTLHTQRRLLLREWMLTPL
jgi:hypothetical protein